MARKLVCVDPGTSLGSLAKLSEFLNNSEEFAGRTLKRKELQKEVERSLKIDTPYGSVIETVSLDVYEGDAIAWPVINPMALLYVFCEENPDFGSLLQQSGKKLFHISLYSDETCPGNTLHPDTTKMLQCVYWTIQELPSWYRNRKSGWWHFSVLRTCVQEDVRGGLSGIMKQVLRKFFPEQGHSFKIGMQLRTNTGKFFFKAKMGCLIQDCVLGM